MFFPIRNADGVLVGVTARDITGNARAKYLNTPTTPAYRKGDHVYAPTRIDQPSLLIVCEGPVDALAVMASSDG
ncbi:hypothetical protein [uncultured Jatrophihabitans sp.]|uniref:hypothetical protein n=1 Tax=uncultured Jatrophihabitans sp. TaxID=1610747 RepID=UPI0035CA4421